MAARQSELERLSELANSISISTEQAYASMVQLMTSFAGPPSFDLLPPLAPDPSSWDWWTAPLAFKRPFVVDDNADPLLEWRRWRGTHLEKGATWSR